MSKTAFEKEVEQTFAVVKANSWMELKSVIKQHAPFISYSRHAPKEWSSEVILANMELVRRGHPINIITRANGLRAKVCELIMGENYGDPWE